MIKDYENKDLEFSRETYLELIRDSQESIQLMLELAKSLEHPRAFEVLAGLIRSTAEINGKLVDLHLSNKELLKPVQKGEAGNAVTTMTTNNNLFLGSTSDLQKLLKDLKKEELSVINNN